MWRLISTASCQTNGGKYACCHIASDLSKSIWLKHSAVPFCWGMCGTVIWCSTWPPHWFWDEGLCCIMLVLFSEGSSDYIAEIWEASGQHVAHRSISTGILPATVSMLKEGIAMVCVIVDARLNILSGRWKRRIMAQNDWGSRPACFIWSNGCMRVLIFSLAVCGLTHICMALWKRRWNNPNGFSVDWSSRELKTKEVRTKSTSNWLLSWSLWLKRGKTKRTRLEFSGRHLRPYILLHMFVHVCTRSTDERSRIFRYLVAWGSGMHQA